jgi:hypothetical protein
VLTDENLVRLILRGMRLREVCGAASICRAWRAVSDSPEFWQDVRLSRRKMARSQVRAQGAGAGAGGAAACQTPDAPALPTTCRGPAGSPLWPRPRPLAACQQPASCRGRPPAARELPPRLSTRRWWRWWPATAASSAWL